MWTVNYLQNFRGRPFHFLGSIALTMCLAAVLLALALLAIPLPVKLSEQLDPAPSILLVGGLVTVLLGLISEWDVGVDAAIAQQSQEMQLALASALHGLLEKRHR
jgi:hypothetical protein